MSAVTLAQLLPKQLKEEIAREYQYIVVEKNTYSLPVSPSVETILEEYEKSHEDSDEPKQLLVREIAAGMRVYFDGSLEAMLLYPSEVSGHAAVKKKEKDNFVCKFYGGRHLLRMFVKLPELLTDTSLTKDTAKPLADGIMELAQFILDRKDDLLPALE